MLSSKVANFIDLCDSPQTIDLASEDNNDHVVAKANKCLVSNSSIRQRTSSTWQPYYLNSIRSDSVSSLAKNNNDSLCLRLDDIIFADKEVVSLVVIMTFEIDVNWLFTAVPLLLSVPLLVLHGGSKKIDGIELENLTISPVDMGLERFGTHHNKIIFVFYGTGVRVAVTTANFTETDWTLKLQATYVQDFPSKRGASSSEFECSLLAHCDRIQPLGKIAQKQFRHVFEKLRLYDYSSAEVVLISSVPGRHQGPNKNKWGQWKLRDELSMAALSDATDYSSDNEIINSTLSSASVDRRLLMQFSSIGSLKSNETYIEELAASMFTTSASPLFSAYEDVPKKKKQKTDSSSQREFPLENDTIHRSKRQLKLPIELVWPTVDCIRGSVQGWGSGFSMPCDEKVLTPFYFVFILLNFTSHFIR